MLTSKLSARQIAKQYGICRATAYVWLDLARGYPEPEADVIRRILRERGQPEAPRPGAAPAPAPKWQGPPAEPEEPDDPPEDDDL